MTGGGNDDLRGCGRSTESTRAEHRRGQEGLVESSINVREGILSVDGDVLNKKMLVGSGERILMNCFCFLKVDSRTLLRQYVDKLCGLLRPRVVAQCQTTKC